MDNEILSPTTHLLVREILCYLIQYTDAKDTIDGILQWWIPQIHRQQGREVVQEALNFLVRRNWLFERITANVEKIYYINKDMLQEIKVFVNKT